MSTRLVPGRDSQLEIGTITIILSSIVYGLEVSMYIICVQGLLKGKQLYSKRARRFLITYVSVMLLLGTMDLVQDILGIMADIFQLHQQLLNLQVSGYAILPLTIWGADGFMLWRCAKLYQGLSPLPRAALYCFLVFISFSLLVSGVIMLALRALGPLQSPFILIAFSTFTNTSVSTLITLRLLHHRKHVQTALGAESGLVYTRAIMVCVESCFLIAIFDILCLALSSGIAAVVPVVLLPHVCVISILLLINRVARGRAAPIVPRLPVDSETSIHFADPVARSNTSQAQSGAQNIVYVGPGPNR